MDEATAARFRSEELEHSQIMHTLHMLTDRYGPRVTGTPNHEAAAKWVVKQFNKWGFKNAHLEPWDFGHPGWSNERATRLHRVAGEAESEIRSAGLDAFHQGHGHRLDRAARAAAGAGDSGGSAERRQRRRSSAAAARTRPQRLGPTKEEMETWLAANQPR